jgi:hypothetical protein
MLADLEESWMRWIVAGLAGLLSAVPATAQFAAPEAAVSALYARYKGKAPNNGPGFPSDAAGVRRFLEPGLAQAWLKDGNLGADPFIDGQDWEISGLSIGQPVVTGDRARVQVRFRNFGEPRLLTYRLVRNPDGWRIYDVNGLRRELKVTN